MSRKVLFAQPVHEAGKKLLEENGFEVVETGEENPSPERVKELIADCEGVFSKTFFLTEDILRAGKRLKVIGKHGVGVDNVVDVDTATKLNLYVVRSPMANSDSVAEHTVGGMLAFSEKVVRMHLAAKNAEFDEQNCGGMTEIGKKTVGIIGLGNIGIRVAKICALGFDMRVIGYDPYIARENLPDYVEMVDDINLIYREADYITLHLGATPETIGMIGREQLEMMKPSAVLLNQARGSLVKEEELIEALKKGIIRGAVIDVFSEEPVHADNGLLQFDNDKVLLSPHSAALTEEAMENMSYDGCLGIVEILTGRQPTWCMNYNEVQQAI